MATGQCSTCALIWPCGRLLLDTSWRRHLLSVPDDTKDLDAERDWPAVQWHEYAKEFGVFVREQRQVPEVWEPELHPPDRNRRLGPQLLKRWAAGGPL